MRSIKILLALAVCAISLKAQVVTGGLIPSSVNAVYTFGLGRNGAACDNSTDDTTAFNALLATVNTAGGGSIQIAGGCLIAGTVVFPNDGASPPTQKTIEIYGYGNTTNGQWGAIPAARSFLNLTNNATVAKLDTRGIGQLIIHDLNIIDSAADCAAFIQTTNTGLTIYDVTFSGTGAGLSACNDGIVLGSTTMNTDGTATAAFQGYHTEIRNNFFDKIRRGIYGRTFSNATRVYSNTWSTTTGSNLTTAIGACTNANPTVCTVTGIGLTVGTSYSLRITGATGSWTAINGTKAVVPITINTFSITGVDATAFGALAGSPVFLSGAAIEFAASAGPSTSGNFISANLIEISNYPFGIRLNTGIDNQVYGNGFYDPVSNLFLAYYRLENGSSGNEIIHGFGSDVLGSVLSIDALNSSNMVLNAHAVSAMPQPIQTNTLRSSVNQAQGFVFQNSTGSATILTVDTSNNRIGIGTTGPTVALDVTGAANFSGLVTANTGIKIAAGQVYATTGRGDMFSPADGFFEYRDSTAGATAFLGLKFGGATSSSPALLTGGGTQLKAGLGDGTTKGSFGSGQYAIVGTKFTAAGCSNSTTVGGASAGSFASGTTGACAVTVTMGDAQTAPNGWSCWAADTTTPANLYSQNGGNTTTATFTGTTVSGDVIRFGCMSY